ncbi:MAG TPA: adenylate/guanylate cyclase domain-containing protein [Stellaceae bacterium]|nr:adenylate/guanylate cyclase domain-containing protein [Stellaceae bacterium]
MQLIDFLSRTARRWLAASERTVPWLILAIALTGKLIDPLPVAQIRRAAFDYLQRLAPRDSQATPIRVIAIDDESLSRIGQWPWPRRILAHMLDRLRAADARLAVFDIVFAEPDRTSPSRLLAEEGVAETLPADLAERLPDHDAVFTAALRRMPSVLGFVLVNDAVGEPPAQPYSVSYSGPDPQAVLPAYRGVIATLPNLAAAAAGSGSINNLPDPDGIDRRLPLVASAFGHVYPSLVLEAARVLVGDRSYGLKTVGGSGERSLAAGSGGIVGLRIGSGANGITVPTDAQGALVLHLPGRASAPIIPAWRLLDGTVPPDELAGSIAMIGTTAKALTDINQTALGPRPGLELQSEALSQILLGAYITRPDWAAGLELTLAFVLGAGLILAFPHLSPVAGALVSLLVIALLGAASWIAFTRFAWQFDAVYPGLTLFAVAASATIAAFARSDRERAFIRHAFSRYLSPELVKRLADDPRALRLSGERREMTFLFTDIAGFTGLSERLGPAALAPILNEYFDGACAVIFAEGGMVNEFVGDAILAFFNAPLDQPDHARRALAAARALDRFAEGFRRTQVAHGIAFGATRIGVHTGSALVGNFGATQRFKYSALGDVVNTASRIEGLNKYFGTRACASATTVAATGDTRMRPIGSVTVSGKTEALTIFEILAANEPDDAFLDRYRSAYLALEAGRLEEARALFEALHAAAPADGPVAFHLDRLRRDAGSPVIVMTEK